MIPIITYYPNRLASMNFEGYIAENFFVLIRIPKMQIFRFDFHPSPFKITIRYKLLRTPKMTRQTQTIQITFRGSEFGGSTFDHDMQINDTVT